MNTYKRTARIVGALFIIAIVTSIVGGVMIDSVLAVPDVLSNVSANETSLLIGVFLELVNGIAVIGIVTGLFPILRQQNEAQALGYVGLRIIEVAIIVVAVVPPLTLLAFSQELPAAGAGNDRRFIRGGARPSAWPVARDLLRPGWATALHAAVSDKTRSEIHIALGPRRGRPAVGLEFAGAFRCSR
jgi:hypothetical protein